MNILQEVQHIIADIEMELNMLNKKYKKTLKNNVYFMSSAFLNVTDKNKQNRLFAFVIKKSFWGKLSLVLMSSDDFLEKYDDYKIYKNKESLTIFDDETLVKIKYFLLSFGSTE